MFNPMHKKGLPIQKQFKNWKTLNTRPYDKESIHPYSRTAGILMNGIECEAAFFMHNFARHTKDMELRGALAMVRRAEQEQQKMINWMIPGNESSLEVTIGYEQVAVDLTAFLAQKEKDPYVKEALDFALLEDFDHLYRYANLMRLTMGKEASDVTKEYTEITVGRPTSKEHRFPEDDVRNFTDKRSADPMSNLHIMTIVAAEQQTMNYYMNIGNRFEDMLARGLYLEIAQIEEQHVTHYESLIDPRMSWFEQWVCHELTECWLYHSLMKNDHEQRSQKVWEQALDMELEHLKIASENMKKHDKKDPEELSGGGFTHMFEFKSNIDYVRNILETQADFGAMGPDFVPGSKIPENYRYFQHQKIVNEGGAPSDEVIDRVIKKDGHDFRQELKPAMAGSVR
ncbi:MAG: hypothetical protein PHE18_02245 [Candidatus Omnitrophica bacterium]|nr:hypothetical protein [Candidatus Omnitrophota bacterium]MDD5552673.1 hypothetical protein [Candidatus Omnitrophota bacterium]